jgi:hypothetical protein
LALGVNRPDLDERPGQFVDPIESLLSLPYVDDVMQPPEEVVQADALVSDPEVETWI